MGLEWWTTTGVDKRAVDQRRGFNDMSFSGILIRRLGRHGRTIARTGSVWQLIPNWLRVEAISQFLGFGKVVCEFVSWGVNHKLLFWTNLKRSNALVGSLYFDVLNSKEQSIHQYFSNGIPTVHLRTKFRNPLQWTSQRYPRCKLFPHHWTNLDQPVRIQPISGQSTPTKAHTSKKKKLAKFKWTSESTHFYAPRSLFWPRSI